MDGDVLLLVLTALEALGGIVALLELTNMDTTEPSVLSPVDALLPDFLRRLKTEARDRILSLEREDAARRALNRQRAWDELVAAVRKDLGPDLAALGEPALPLGATPPEGFGPEGDEWWAELLLAGHHPVRARYVRQGGAGWQRVPAAGDENLSDPLRREGDRCWWAVAPPGEPTRYLATLGAALHFAEEEESETVNRPDDDDIPF